MRKLTVNAALSGKGQLVGGGKAGATTLSATGAGGGDLDNASATISQAVPEAKKGKSNRIYNRIKGYPHA